MTLAPTNGLSPGIDDRYGALLAASEAIVSHGESKVATTVRVIRSNDFIRASVDGFLDQEASLKLINEIVSLGDSLGKHQVLVDTRKTTSRTLIAAELWFLAEAFAVAGRELVLKTAVLCPVNEFNNAEFFALCSQNRGMRVTAFTSFEDAFEWLMAESSGA